MNAKGLTADAVQAAVEHSWFKLREIRHDRDLNACWQFAWRKLEVYTLFVPLSAEGMVIVNGRVRALRPGAAVVCAPGQEVAATAMLKDGRGIYVIQFSAGSTDDGRADPGGLFLLQGEWAYTPSQADLALYETMERHWRGGSGLERLRSQAAFLEWLSGFLQGYIAEQAEGMKAGLAWAKLHMEQHFDEEVTIEWLAEKIKVSPRHFRRSFKDAYGISAINYLTEQRIHQAKARMEEGSKTLGEIAREVGYESESYFRRMFKSQVGVPPAQYIRNRKLRTAAYSWPNIGQLLPLQIIPHAAPIDHYWTDFYRRKYRFEVTVPLRHRYDYNREALRAFRPDCIVGLDAFVPAEEQERLAGIAPTLFLPWLTEDWQTHLRITAAFLDREPEAEAWLREYDQRVRLAADRLLRQMSRERLRIVMVDKEDVYLWTGRGSSSGSVSKLPFAPRRLDRPGPEFVPLAREERTDPEAERILVLLSEDIRSAATWRDLQCSDGWKAQPAALGRQVHAIRLGPDFDYSAFNHGLILEQFEAFFKEALKS